MTECKWCGEIASVQTKIGWLCEECVEMSKESEHLFVIKVEDDVE